jgi:hypothetical protein
MARFDRTRSSADDGMQEVHVEAAARHHMHDVIVEVEGRVEKLLRDDVWGSRHQRFILKLRSGRTLLIANNLDLGTRVPVAKGDWVAVRGVYESNDKGGVVHWTHRDPDGAGFNGWIRHEARKYD